MGSNIKKSQQLGMSFGTANNRLRKMILFKMVQNCKEDICYRCGEKILNIKNFSIEHKKPWLDRNPDLFWDLNNIAFSHLKCNIAHRRIPNKIELLTGHLRCATCKDIKDKMEFSPCYRKD